MLKTVTDSSNIKLRGRPGSPKYKGQPISATMRKVGASGAGTCPSTCGMLPENGGGCYAGTGNVGIHSRQSGYDPTDAVAVYRFVQGLWDGATVRHHVSGDFFLGSEPDLPYIRSMAAAHRERPGVTGFTYTHGWRQIAPVEFGDAGELSVNASCESVEEAREARALGWKSVVVVVPSTENRRSWKEGELHFTLCPNVTTGIGCVACRLCALKDRDTVIAFPAHGSLKKRVDARLEALTQLPMASD